MERRKLHSLAPDKELGQPMSIGKRIISLTREQTNLLVVWHKVVRPSTTYTQTTKLDSAYAKHIHTHIAMIKKKRLPTWKAWGKLREGSWEGWREGQVI